MKMAVLWSVASCSLVEIYRRFRGACCLYHQGYAHIALMMEAARNSETSVNLYQTTTTQKTAIFMCTILFSTMSHFFETDEIQFELHVK
jgi:hypothetical protein